MRVLLMMLLLASFGAAAQGEDRSRASESPEVPIAEVPDVVLTAAKEARPGAFFHRAERTYWNDEPVFVLEGAQVGKVWLVYVGSQGQVKHISSDWQGD